MNKKMITKEKIKFRYLTKYMDLIKSVIYEDQKWFWIIILEDYRKYLYDNFITPNRICVVDTSQDFWDDIQLVSDERLEKILKSELDENPLSLYGN